MTALTGTIAAISFGHANEYGEWEGDGNTYLEICLDDPAAQVSGGRVTITYMSEKYA